MTFLEHTCVKAGLPPGAWKEPDTRLSVFEAQVFAESTAPLTAADGPTGMDDRTRFPRRPAS
ncbi:hypothetical protein D3C83_82780 [compost metagenome]